MSFDRKDMIILMLSFLLITSTAPIFLLVDETALETHLPFFTSLVGGLTFLMEMVVNFPIMLLVQFLSPNSFYIGDAYFDILLPLLTGIIWTGLVAYLLSRVNKRRAKAS